MIGSHRRTIAFNTRQGGILNNVGVLDGDASACLQTAGAELDTAITAEAVTFDVATTSGPLFTTSPPTGAQIIVREREIMTVTAISRCLIPADVYGHPRPRTASSSCGCFLGEGVPAAAPHPVKLRHMLTCATVHMM